MADSGPRADDITRVLGAVATVLDSLNPLRNNASVAHPNAQLLDEPEAHLAINAARSVFAFLDAKLGAMHRTAAPTCYPVKLKAGNLAVAVAAEGAEQPDWPRSWPAARPRRTASERHQQPRR